MPGHPSTIGRMVFVHGTVQVMYDQRFQDELQSVFFLLFALYWASRSIGERGISRWISIVLTAGILSLAVPRGIWREPQPWYSWVEISLMAIVTLLIIVQKIGERRRGQG